MTKAYNQENKQMNNVSLENVLHKLQLALAPVYLRFAEAISGLVAGTCEPRARQALAAGLAVRLPALVVRVVFARLVWDIVQASVVAVPAVRGDFSSCCSSR